MKLSARNQIKGTIKEVKEGVITATVYVDIGNDNVITSSITMDSAKSMDLKIGKEVFVVVKASNVMIGIDD